jgi:hypothetical protein
MKTVFGISALILVATLNTAFAADPNVALLPGEYAGTNAVGDAECHVTVVQNGDLLSFTASSEKNGQTMTFTNVGIEALQKKLAADTQFRIREDKNYDAINSVVTYYRQSGITAFGPTESSGLEVDWYNGVVDLIVLSATHGAGPFHLPGEQQDISCFSLKRMN